jgi:hypothetical protein
MPGDWVSFFATEVGAAADHPAGFFRHEDRTTRLRVMAWPAAGSAHGPDHGGPPSVICRVSRDEIFFS